ncbi:unnamed protein product, partial [marine sediment metagenome]
HRQCQWVAEVVVAEVVVEEVWVLAVEWAVVWAGGWVWAAV